MPLSVVQITFCSPIQHSIILHNLTPATTILPKTLFPSGCFGTTISLRRFIFSTTNTTSLCSRTKPASTHASLLETPVLWAGRLCIFYALLKAGLAGSPANPLVSDLDIGDSNQSGDLGFSKWTEGILGKPVGQNISTTPNLQLQGSG